MTSEKVGSVKLRDYQLESLNVVFDYFASDINSPFTLSLPPNGGKTITSIARGSNRTTSNYSNKRKTDR